MDKLGDELKEQNQSPDMSGTIDTVAFCIKNIVNQSWYPYIKVDIEPGSDDVVLDLPLMLPYLTQGSKYALYGLEDVEMNKCLGTFVIEEVNGTQNAEVCFHESVNDQFLDKITLRAVEISHKPDMNNLQHYTGVFVQDHPAHEDLKRILSDLKAEMYLQRNKFPVKDLPKSCFIRLVEDRVSADIIACLENKEEGEGTFFKPPVSQQRQPPCPWELYSHDEQASLKNVACLAACKSY